MKRARTLSESLALARDTSDQADDPFADEIAGGQPPASARHRGILVRTRPEAWRELKRLAVERDTTLQALMTEAINALLVKHNRPPLA